MQANKTLITTKTTMRYAFEAAVARAAATKSRRELQALAAGPVGQASPRAGVKKAPGWRVTRRGSR